MSKNYRLNLELNEEASKLLDELTETTGKTKAELLRQALILRAFLEREKREGKSIAVTRDNQIEKEIILS